MKYATMKCATRVAAALALCLASPQDGTRQDPPARAKTGQDRPASKPAPPPALLGVWKLATCYVDGMPIAASGYLSIHEKHLSLHLMSTPTGRAPQIQSAFRSYRVTGDKLVTTVLLGVRSIRGDRIAADKAGEVAVREFRIVEDRLILDVDKQRRMEFTRVE